MTCRPSRLARIALEGVPYHIIHLGKWRHAFLEERVIGRRAESLRDSSLARRKSPHLSMKPEDTITIHRVRDRREATAEDHFPSLVCSCEIAQE